MADYTWEILTRSHPRYTGWKTEAGAKRISGLLEILDTQEGRLDETIKQFLKALPNPAVLSGFYLEVRIAAAMIKAMPDWKFSSELKEGKATKPCDITAKSNDYRIDIQCKQRRNYSNEGHTEDFDAWLITAFHDREPGLLLTFQATVAAKEDDFRELRQWMNDNESKLEAGAIYNIETARGQFEIGVEARTQKGIAIGTTWSAASSFGLALPIDPILLRKQIIERIKEAKATFAEEPTEKVFNMVAMQYPSLSMVADDDVFTALYGNKWTGPFSKCEYPYCTGVLMASSEAQEPDRFATFPNGCHFQAVVESLRRFPCFTPPVDPFTGKSFIEFWPTQN